MELKYAKGPVSYLYSDLKNKKGKMERKRVKQLLWGDWVKVLDDESDNWFNVTYGNKPFLMKKNDLQDERVLEIIFLDIGQGDSCIFTEPGSHFPPRVCVVDAGIGRNTNGFLNWRFKDFDSSGQIHAAIVTHPDQDHYQGFQPIFQNKKLKIEHVYHNGLVERTGDDLLGPLTDGYFTEIVSTNEEMSTLMSDKTNRGRKRYPKLMKTALDNPSIGPVEALTTVHSQPEGDKVYMPGFAPSDPGPVDIEVLGPVIEPDGNGNPRLRAFGSKPTSSSVNNGKSKNGHSVLLRLNFNGFRVLFGGDLNKSSEVFLLQHYGETPSQPAPFETTEEHLEELSAEDVIKNASERFNVDLMKTCHHGSSDVTNEFLQVSSASAYVISSGDEEGHVHPRPDLLGLLGKMGAGHRPLLLSTELMRSTRERESGDIRKKLDALHIELEEELLKNDDADKDQIKKLKAKRRSLLNEALKRNVGVYGAINLRTDGKTAVIAFRKEKSSPKSRWFYYELERDEESGAFFPELKAH